MATARSRRCPFRSVQPEFTSIDISNQVVNLIPAQARARFNIRFNDCHSQISLKTLIERAQPSGGRARALAHRLGALERRFLSCSQEASFLMS
jgi:hypothetical protein